VLGKTKTPEFTLGGEIDNPVYGKTFNPYRLTHSPGSGGAIVAAGGSALDLGSDRGGSIGSIREPAVWFLSLSKGRLAGIKPTAGRVSRARDPIWVWGHVDYDWSTRPFR
jgi:amidase